VARRICSGTRCRGTTRSKTPISAQVLGIQNQSQNLSAAEDGIRAADIAQEVANMTKFSILNQTGISSLAQANAMQQQVLALLR
jgi:flagellin-like hook-associated protein FlgL